jgi:hypothetical protein
MQKIRKPYLFHAVIHIGFSFCRICGQSVSPDPDLGDHQTGLFRCFLILDYGLLGCIRLHRKYNGGASQSDLTRSPFLGRIMF